MILEASVGELVVPGIDLAAIEPIEDIFPEFADDKAIRNVL